MEVIRTLIAGVINRLDNFKSQGDATVQQVAGVRGDLEAAMLRMNQNFQNMASDFNDQRQVINALGENLKACRKEQKAVCARMESSMDAWVEVQEEEEEVIEPVTPVQCPI